MNNIEEKAIIDVKDSYETISLESNECETRNSNTNSNSNGYQSYSSLPISSNEAESNTVCSENSQWNLDSIYQSLTLKASKVLDIIVIEKSYKMFFCFLITGLILIFLSLLMLPMFMITPTKFVITFGSGSIIILLSFVFLYGFKDYCLMLIEQNRKWLTLSFFLSILFGIIFAWKGKFFLSLFFAVYQMIAVIMFSLSFVPGGENGILFIKDILQSPFNNIWEIFRNKFASTLTQNKDSYLPEQV